jgi:hypothetical protein
MQSRTERVTDERGVADKWGVSGKRGASGKQAASGIHSLAVKIHATHAANSPGCQLADFLPGHLAIPAQSVRLNSARYGHAASHCLLSFLDCQLPLIASGLGIRATPH